METTTLSPSEVDKAQRSPLDYAEVASGGWFHRADHLEHLNDLLLAIEQRKIKRLMVFMPPRHSKSETVSHFLPAWWLGRHPDDRVILASYGADWAEHWGREVRNTLAEYGEAIHGLKVAEDSSAAGRWQIEGHRGGMTAVGIGGAITGRGANLLIIDDPVKNPEEAWSVTIQNRNAQWWDGAAYTRLEPDAVIIVVMTRWHENDLAGYILRNSTEQWHVLRLPALAEADDPMGRAPGDALWRERFDEAALQQIKKELSKDDVGYYWLAEYQQRPAIPEGLLYFDRASIEAGLHRVEDPRERTDTRPAPDAAADGFVLVWERPITSGIYYIGADTADGKGEVLGTMAATGGPDRNAAAIYKWPENVQVAAIYGRQEEHQYARLLNQYGRWYNNALLAVERNRRAVLVALRELNYPNLYATPRATDMHLINQGLPRQMEYGWDTNTKTRPMLLSDFREVISAGTLIARDRKLFEECLTFVVGDPPAAAPGQHDDVIIAHAIANQARRLIRTSNAEAGIRNTGIRMGI